MHELKRAQMARGRPLDAALAFSLGTIETRGVPSKSRVYSALTIILEGKF
jgi:hypothetical protein